MDIKLVILDVELVVLRLTSMLVLSNACLSPKALAPIPWNSEVKPPKAGIVLGLVTF